MKTITVNRSDLQSAFVVPPELAGQTIEYSYAQTEDYIVERTYDRSDRSESYTAYRHSRSGFAPQNRAPKLGQKIGPVRIEETV